MRLISSLLASALFLSSIGSTRALDLGPVLGGVGGAAIGAAIGGRNAGAGAVVGGIIGVSIGMILQQLTEAEKAKRQTALQQAAKGKSSTWSTSGKSGKKATYTKVGTSTNGSGQKCSKVRETITLADGKQGVSEETVCFS